VTALAKLLRTTAFRLTLVYLLVFALFAAFLLGYFALNTRRLITEQINTTIRTELTGLSEQYSQNGLRRLVVIIDNRSRRPGSSLFLITTPTGVPLAGNVGQLQSGVLDGPGCSDTAYRRLEETEGPEHFARVCVVSLGGGFRLLIGRDLEERARMTEIIATAGRWSVAIVVILGVAGGIFVSKRVLNRVDAMTGTSQTIMAGDLSGRLPVTGTGDELDRLASNLNAMLERIESLMRGLKEVSDNVAHDLKAPLTRLRNRCEEALRAGKSEGDYRAALEATIEESEGLIRTFDALLMIARAESGEARHGMTEFDAAEIARDVSELYEPLADDKGLSLHLEAPSPAPVKGNRELVSQALANLVDNAIKYTTCEQQLNGEVYPEIIVSAAAHGDRIMLSVGDKGPGIPESEKPRVIERFVRLEQSRSKPGSGLGLSLAAAVARLHGGELRLEDNNPGLKAVIELPRADPILGTA
jgi:signal transduction histidine kinase